MATDKITKAATAASRNGDGLASATLNFLASIYLLGRDDLMKYVWVAAQAAAEQAAEEKQHRGRITPPGPDSRDRIDEALETAARLSLIDGEETLSAVLSFAHALRMSGRADVLQQLKDVAESLAHKGLGTKPPKEITILEDADGGEAS